MKIGDECAFKAERAPNGESSPFTAEIIKLGDKKPYVKAEISQTESFLTDIPIPKNPTRNFVICLLPELLCLRASQGSPRAQEEISRA